MHEEKPNSKKTVNFSPMREHQRQMAWQVWLPLIISLVIVLALMTLAVIGTVQGNSQVNHWGNISAIFIMIPVLIFSLLLLGILVGADYGMTKLLKNVPGWMLKAQLFMIRLSLSIRRAADTSAEPVFKVNTFSTRASTLWKKVVHPKSSS